jgi:hypothetical protein
MVKGSVYMQSKGVWCKLRSPCRVGDIVYRVNKGAIKPVIEMIVTEIRFKLLRSGRLIEEIITSDDVATMDGDTLVYHEKDFGRNVFLTKDMAEQALDKMKSEVGKC